MLAPELPISWWLTGGSWDSEVTSFDGAILGTHGICAPLTLNTIIVWESPLGAHCVYMVVQMLASGFWSMGSFTWKNALPRLGFELADLNRCPLSLCAFMYVNGSTC